MKAMRGVIKLGKWLLSWAQNTLNTRSRIRTITIDSVVTMMVGEKLNTVGLQWLDDDGR